MAERTNDVSVVIPSRGRESLLRATLSAAAQDIGRARVEVIVVIDGPQAERDIWTTRLGPAADRVLATGGGRGAARARQLGTATASCDWVAYLDDDDWWLPNKLSIQLAAVGTVPPSRVVISCLTRAVGEDGRYSREIPAKPYRSGSSVAEYLFRRRGPVVARPSIHTSTLVASKSLALEIGWDGTLRRHQDWDWTVRAVHACGASLVQVPAALVAVGTGSASSISASADWRGSLQWYAKEGAQWSAPTRADFLAGQPLRYALHARSWEGVRAVLWELSRTRRMPSLPSVLLGAAGAVPRGVLERAAARVGATPARPRQLKVVQFPVHDLEYPRNRVIRGALERAGHRVIAIDRGHGAFGHATWRSKLRAVGQLLRSTPGADVILLSEMSLAYAPVTWLLARLAGAVHVVDGFIGLHETRVGDLGLVPESSLRAAVLRVLDDLALRTADIYLIDTEVRAEAIRRRRSGHTVLSIPVGAPPWALPTPFPPPGDTLRVLYYGNYIPLHGVPVIVQAMAYLSKDTPAQLTLVGHGPERPEVERLVTELGLEQLCRFVGRVPEARLADYISDAHVVLGVFGTSEKAGSVLPHKVWQGLACGRFVVTRTSDALRELALSAGSQLTAVPPGDADALAHALRSLAGRVPADAQVSDELRAAPRGALAEFVALLGEQAR